MVKLSSGSDISSTAFSWHSIKVGRRRRLYCYNGFYVEIGYNGAVKGTRNQQSPLVIMEIIPAGKDKIQIRGAHTGFFLAVNYKGDIYTTRVENNDCLFKEYFSRDLYDSYICQRGGETLTLAVARTSTVVAIPPHRVRKFKGSSSSISSTLERQQHETKFLTKKADS